MKAIQCFTPLKADPENLFRRLGEMAFKVIPSYSAVAFIDTFILDILSAMGVRRCETGTLSG